MTLKELLIFSMGAYTTSTDFNTLLSTLYSHERVYITYVSDTDNVEQIDLATVPKPNNYTVSLTSFITEVFDDALPKIIPVKTLDKKKSLVYCNLTETSVRADKVNTSFLPTSKLLDYADIELQNLANSFGSLTYVNNNLVFLVGGRMYPITTLQEKHYLLGSVKSINASGYNIIGILDFKELGGYTAHKVSLLPHVKKNDFTIEITPNFSLSGVTPLVVLDGLIDLSFSSLSGSIGNTVSLHIEPLRALQTTHTTDFSNCKWISNVDGQKHVVDLSTFDIMEYVKENVYILIHLQFLRFGIPKEHLHRNLRANSQKYPSSQ